jgi:hypothetical protein
MDNASALTPPDLRREPHGTWARRIGTLFHWGVLVPFTRVVGRRWPRMLARTMTRTIGSKFGDYVPGAGDVLVCSYFKSGTNWTLQIAVQIAHRGRAIYRHIHDVVPWPDMPQRSRYAVAPSDDSARRQCPTGLRVIKTHLALGPVPFTEAARYICVVRDPKDVFVSSYHFIRSMAGPALMPTVAGWLDAFLSPDTALGSWAQHVASYWRVRDRANVLFLTYEEMRSDLPAAVDRIAAFLRVELNAAERAAVVEQATFEHMKGISRKFDPIGPPWSSTEGAIVRRGERGRSAELISAADQRRIDDYWRAELQRLHCDFPYDEAFGVTAERS